MSFLNIQFINQFKIAFPVCPVIIRKQIFPLNYQLMNRKTNFEKACYWVST